MTASGESVLELRTERAGLLQQPGAERTYRWATRQPARIDEIVGIGRGYAKLEGRNQAAGREIVGDQHLVAHGDAQPLPRRFHHHAGEGEGRSRRNIDAGDTGGCEPAAPIVPPVLIVQENMVRMKHFLQQHGWLLEKTLIVGDRANLSDELALTYDEHDMHYLAGLRVLKKVHRALLLTVPSKQFDAHPLAAAPGANGYWGRLCSVPFAHKGRQVTHRGLVVLSGPMRAALRQTRAAQLWALRHSLCTVRDKIGQPRYRTVKCVQRAANAKLKASPVGKLVRAEATDDEQGQVTLRWWVDRHAFWQASERDGRYLLVTNDWSLSAQRMFDLYHQKDGVEKRIRVSKHDLKVSPIYLHRDERIEAMLVVNMLALLAYSLLERQVRQRGVQMTTRQIIAKLHSLDVVVTCCWDGSQLYRLTPIDEEQLVLLQVLGDVLADLSIPRAPYPMLSVGPKLLLALPPPSPEAQVA